jgi:hypothetical protein
MKFISIDGTEKRVAHTSGVIEVIGTEPINLPTEHFEGLLECAMAAGCIPADGTLPAGYNAAPAVDTTGIENAALADADVIRHAAIAEAAKIIADAQAQAAALVSAPVYVAPADTVAAVAAAAEPAKPAKGKVIAQ